MPPVPTPMNQCVIIIITWTSIYTSVVGALYFLFQFFCCPLKVLSCKSMRIIAISDGWRSCSSAYVQACLCCYWRNQRYKKHADSSGPWNSLHKTTRRRVTVRRLWGEPYPWRKRKYLCLGGIQSLNVLVTNKRSQHLHLNHQKTQPWVCCCVHYTFLHSLFLHNVFGFFHFYRWKSLLEKTIFWPKHLKFWLYNLHILT